MKALFTVEFLHEGNWKNLYEPKIIDIDFFENLKDRFGGKYLKDWLQVEFSNNKKVETRQILGDWFRYTLEKQPEQMELI